MTLSRSGTSDGVDVEVLAVAIPPAAVKANKRNTALTSRRATRPPAGRRGIAVAIADSLGLLRNIEQAVAVHHPAHPLIGHAMAGDVGRAPGPSLEAALS